MTLFNVLLHTWALLETFVHDVVSPPPECGFVKRSKFSIVRLPIFKETPVTKLYMK